MAWDLLWEKSANVMKRVEFKKLIIAPTFLCRGNLIDTVVVQLVRSSKAHGGQKKMMQANFCLKINCFHQFSVLKQTRQLLSKECGCRRRDSSLLSALIRHSTGRSSRKFWHKLAWGCDQNGGLRSE